MLTQHNNDNILLDMNWIEKWACSRLSDVGIRIKQDSELTKLADPRTKPLLEALTKPWRSSPAKSTCGNHLSFIIHQQHAYLIKNGQETFNLDKGKSWSRVFFLLSWRVPTLYMETRRHFRTPRNFSIRALLHLTSFDHADPL